MAKGYSLGGLIKALGSAAFLNVGKGTGQVAAGDDSRIVNALQKGNNLSDILDAYVARGNIGAYANRGYLSDRDLNGLFGQKESGVWYQSANANATGARHYPTETAGQLIVLPGAANGPNASTQLYFPFNTQNVFYQRTMDHDWAWSGWSYYEPGNILRPLITNAQNTANNALNTANNNSMGKMFTNRWPTRIASGLWLNDNETAGLSMDARGKIMWIHSNDTQPQQTIIPADNYPVIMHNGMSGYLYARLENNGRTIRCIYTKENTRLTNVDIWP